MLNKKSTGQRGRLHVTVDQVAGLGEDFRGMTSTLEKKKRIICELLEEYGQAAYLKEIQRFQKSVVVVPTHSVKMPAPCKNKAELHKYLCGFTECILVS